MKYMTIIMYLNIFFIQKKAIIISLNLKNKYKNNYIYQSKLFNQH
jgi:hypothetical protein